MSVMGILILVTLLMALQLTHSVATASAVDQEVDEITAIDSDGESNEELEAKSRRLKQQLDQLSAQIEREANLSVDQQQVATRLRRELAEKYERVTELQQKVKRIVRKIKNPSAENLESDRRLILMRQEAKHLKAELDDIKLHPKLTYIVQQGEDKKAMILELRGDRIGVGAPDDASAATWFKAADPELRFKQFLAWTRSRNSRNEYFVIILKPSGVPLLDPLKIQLGKLGYDVGTDFVSENVRVLPD